MANPFPFHIKTCPWLSPDTVAILNPPARPLVITNTKPMKPRYIITANYRDRKSPYKWLVRRANEPLAAAKACKGVTASGVEFKQSRDGEDGFGCAIVAEASHATMLEIEPEPSTLDPNRFEPLATPVTSCTLEFIGYCFVDKNAQGEDRQAVDAADHLELFPDGSMFCKGPKVEKL